MPRIRVPTLARLLVPTLAATVWFPFGASTALGQGHDPHPGHGAPHDTRRAAEPPDSGAHDMAGMADAAMAGHRDHGIEMLHMKMTPLRAPTRADSAKALELADEIRAAIAKYRDPRDAELDGYRMFLPDVKNQRVYHFTNYGHAIGERFRFDVKKPTSLLYERASDGSLRLVGAMYTMPKRASLERLDARIPLSIARWHQHVNWCIPKRGDRERWMETRDGQPVFGPASPIATKEACDAVGGDFHATTFGWMVHANVFEGSTLAEIFGDEH